MFKNVYCQEGYEIYPSYDKLAVSALLEKLNINVFNEDSDVKDLIEAGFAVQPVNTSGPAIITATSPAITSVRPRSPYAANHAVTRR